MSRLLPLLVLVVLAGCAASRPPTSGDAPAARHDEPPAALLAALDGPIHQMAMPAAEVLPFLARVSGLNLVIEPGLEPSSFIIPSWSGTLRAALDRYARFERCRWEIRREAGAWAVVVGR